MWLNELDQFDGIEAVRSILNSLRRSGGAFWIFYSYNPPRTMWSWVNVESLERAKRADTLVRRSSYLDVVFDDSIIQDVAAEKAQDMAEVGVTLNAWEYRMKWLGEDEQTARKHAAEIGLVSDSGR